jgi:flagellar protein FlaF
MSLQAYQRTATQAEDPRQLEYRLFGQVTRALIDASQADPLDVRTRIDALDWNRRLWTVLASDCGREENQLPEATRAGIISLSMWVQRHSSAVMRRQEEFGPLIEVNRMIMQGLAGQAE